jgi:hypothetical protein
MAKKGDMPTIPALYVDKQFYFKYKDKKWSINLSKDEFWMDESLVSKLETKETNCMIFEYMIDNFERYMDMSRKQYNLSLRIKKLLNNTNLNTKESINEFNKLTNEINKNFEENNYHDELFEYFNNIKKQFEKS